MAQTLQINEEYAFVERKPDIKWVSQKRRRFRDEEE